MTLQGLFTRRLIGRIADAPASEIDALVEDGQTVLWLLDLTTEKSIASVVRRFHADWRNLVTLGFVSSGSILADARRIIKNAIGDAYVEGLKEGGVSFDEMDSDDALMIVELTDQQTQYVTDFVKAVRDAKGDKAAQRAILDRVELWTASVEAAGQAGLASAKRNEMVTFRVSPDAEPSDESCATCKRLLGKSMRRKTVMAKGLLIKPGNTNYECGCWRCPHEWAAIK